MIAHILGFVAGILMVLALFALLTLALRSRGQKDSPQPGPGQNMTSGRSWPGAGPSGPGLSPCSATRPSTALPT